MALKIVEWLFAVVALVEGLAGGGAKLAQQAGVVRLAAGAPHVYLIIKQ